jgi:hypothetical protein
MYQIADVSGGSGAAGLSATRTIWASTPPTPVGDADELGLYAADACLARERFVIDMAARKLDPPSRCRKLGGALSAGLTAPEAHQDRRRA